MHLQEVSHLRNGKQIGRMKWWYGMLIEITILLSYYVVYGGGKIISHKSQATCMLPGSQIVF